MNDTRRERLIQRAENYGLTVEMSAGSTTRGGTFTFRRGGNYRFCALGIADAEVMMDAYTHGWYDRHAERV